MSEKEAVYLHKYDSEKDKKKYISKIFTKRKMPIIKCSCGAEILVLPDIKAMDRAINRHASEHKLKGMNAKERKIAKKKIIDQLIGNLLKKVGTLDVDA